MNEENNEKQELEFNKKNRESGNGKEIGYRLEV